MSRRRASPAAVLLLVAGAAAASAQVDCDTPDDLCTGDPCVIGTVEVDDGCALDFGSRAVVVAGALRMPNSGELALTAGTLAVTGNIANLPPRGAVPGAGPRITLRGAGDVTVDGTIRLAGARGVALPGALTLDAGGALRLRGVVRVATTPSTVDLAAGDVLEIAGRLVAARGDVDVGAVAGGAVVVGGRIRRPRGIAIAAGGDVTLAGTIVPRVAMTVDGGGRVELATTVRAFGADVALRGASEVRVSRPLLLTPLFFVAGSAELASANGLVHVDATVRAPDVRISGAAGVRVSAQVSASPPARSGGAMRIESAAGDVDVSATLRAQAGDGTQPGDGAGGHVVVTAAGAARLASVLVNAFPGRPDAPGGTLAVTAASVSAVGTFDADGDAPGPDFPDAVPAGFRFTATGGDVHLDGAFDARGGPSVLQATAAGTLVAAGVYRVAPAGCIGLSAGGALQTGGATFDTPPVATCP